MVQVGQASWWLPVASVGATTGGRTEVTLTRLAAFEYDGASGLWRETHYPFRVLTGKATARGQANLHLAVTRGDDDTRVVDAFVSCPSRVLLKGVQGRLAARVSGPQEQAWQELPVDLTPAGLVLQFTPAMVGRGRTRIVIGAAEGIDRKLVALAAPGGALAPKSARARYLRIACPGPERSFAFAEAQIFNVHEENVARRGKASQSSTYVTSDGVALAAGLAIDGDTNGAWKEPLSLAATRKESDPWWELDLTGEHDIARVVLLNRTDVAADGIVPATVTLLDAQRHPVRTWEITSVRGKYVFRVE
jgi:hypothetical protein